MGAGGKFDLINHQQVPMNTPSTRALLIVFIVANFDSRPRESSRVLTPAQSQKVRDARPTAPECLKGLMGAFAEAKAGPPRRFHLPLV